MNRHETALLIFVLSVATVMAAVAANYTAFAAQSEVKKDKVIWDLHERREWGLPEQKPVCRDVLANQGYHFANAIAWTTDAIDLTEKQNWNDLNPLITKIYAAPLLSGLISVDVEWSLI